MNFGYKWKDEDEIISSFHWNMKYPLQIKLDKMENFKEISWKLKSFLNKYPKVSLVPDFSGECLVIPNLNYNVEVEINTEGTNRILYTENGYMKWKLLPETIFWNISLHSTLISEDHSKYLTATLPTDLPEGWQLFKQSESENNPETKIQLLFQSALKGVAPASILFLQHYLGQPKALTSEHLLFLENLIHNPKKLLIKKEDVPNDFWVKQDFYKSDGILNEFAIIAFYTIQSHSKSFCLQNLFQAYCESMDAHHMVLYNLLFYMDDLVNESSIGIFHVPYLKGDFDDYTASSSCPLYYNNQIIINVRTVNYRILDKKWYVSMENGQINYDCPLIKTINQVVVLDPISLKTLQEPRVISEEKIKHHFVRTEERIQGIEDVRIYSFKDVIYYYGCSKQCMDQVLMVHGIYDIENAEFKTFKFFPSPTNAYCEKNWTFFTLPHDLQYVHIIYSWYPLVHMIYDPLNPEEEPKKVAEIKTPRFFHNFRGTSPGIIWKNMIWTVTHAVLQPSFKNHREYIYFLVCFDFDLKPLACSIPFRFENESIQYCVGLEISNQGVCTFLYSINDACSRLIQIPMEYFIQSNRFYYLERDTFFRNVFSS